MEHILEEIRNERERQNKKFGEQNHNPMTWIPILTEEVGEASKEALEHHFKYDLSMRAGEDAKKDFAIQKQRLLNYRKELIEVAAVCVSAIQSLERNELEIKK